MESGFLHIVGRDGRGWIVSVEGRTLVRAVSASEWWDAKTNLRLATGEAQHLNILWQSPAVLQAVEAARPAIEAEQREQTLAAHRLRLERSGLPYRGAGPWLGYGYKFAHCWACHHSLDSEVDRQCYACRALLCLCGACFCGVEWTFGLRRSA